MPITIEKAIKNTVSDVYNKAFIKRRNNTDGLYEDDWVEITSYVKKFGTIQSAIDDIKLNSFKSAGINLTVNNSSGKFNRQDETNSLWYGYMTRYRTLVRLVGGYSNVDDTLGTLEATFGADILTNGPCEGTAGWTKTGASAGISASTAHVYQGTYSMYVIKGGSAGEWGFYQNVTTTVGQQYRASAKIHTYNGWQLGLEVVNHNFTNTVNTVSSNVEWNYVAGEFTAQTTTVIFYLRRIDVTTNARYGWVDDCKLETVLTVTTIGVVDNSTQGIFVLTDEVPLSGEKNECALRCKSLNSIFDEVKASDIGGITGTHTASEIIAKIKDATDGAGGLVFRTFIDGIYWHIATTTTNYMLNAGSDLDNMTCWELMTKLAEAEGFVVYIDRKGEFHFQSRAPATSASMFALTGLGYRNMNIKSIPEYYEALNKTYNYIRCKFNTADTSTSYATYGTLTALNSSNPSWMYGQRMYDFENIYLNTTTAAAIVANLYNLYKTPKYNLRVRTKIIPHLNLMDRVTVSYQSSAITGGAGSVGENLSFTNKNFIIINKTVNLDTFECEFLLDEEI